MERSAEQQLLKTFRTLNASQQRYIMAIATSLSALPPGERALSFVAAAQSLDFSDEDLQEIEQAINKSRLAFRKTVS